jgi:hypothetical protein
MPGKIGTDGCTTTRPRLTSYRSMLCQQMKQISSIQKFKRASLTHHHAAPAAMIAL